MSGDPFNHDIVKCTRTRRQFKVDFLKNKASNEKSLLLILDLFSHVKSLPPAIPSIPGHPVCMNLLKHNLQDICDQYW